MALRVRLPSLGTGTSTTLVWIKVSGTWKTATPYIKVSGTWKTATPYIKVSGTWK
jgi:hypothetical protein